MEKSPSIPFHTMPCQLKGIIQLKLRVFVLKVATSGSHLTFLWTSCVNQGRIYHMAQCPALRWQNFFCLYLYLAGRCCENLQSARGPAYYKSGPEITWFVSVTIYCIIFTDNSPPPRQFLRTKYFKKNYSGKMLIEQIIECELRRPGPQGRTCTSITG